MNGIFLKLTTGFALVLASLLSLAQPKPARGPAELRVDNLRTPLGIDDPAPRFSWQLRDSAQGARQTAYQIDVSASADALAEGKADVWTSGRIDGAQSINIIYHGPALVSGKR